MLLLANAMLLASLLPSVEPCAPFRAASIAATESEPDRVVGVWKGTRGRIHAHAAGS